MFTFSPSWSGQVASAGGGGGGGGEGDRGLERTTQHVSFSLYCHFFPGLCSPCRFSPPGCLVEFLFVDVNDVLHQQVSLQAVDAVAIQHHVVSAGRTPETPAVYKHGGSSVEQRWLCIEKKKKNADLRIFWFWFGVSLVLSAS